jgi:hypothetical protein
VNRPKPKPLPKKASDQARKDGANEKGGDQPTKARALLMFDPDRDELPAIRKRKATAKAVATPKPVQKGKQKAIDPADAESPIA